MDANSFRSTLERLGLTQAAFARLVGVDAGTVNRYATGRIAIPAWVGAWLMVWQAVAPAERELLGRQIVSFHHGRVPCDPLQVAA